MTPYFLMAALYAAMVVLSLLDSSLTSLRLLPWFNGLRWLRVHFITLGLLTQVTFGALPALVATQARRPRPRTRWDIWLALNAGLITLLVGIPLVNGALILAGGTLIFIAAGLLLFQLHGLGSEERTAGTRGGRRFYVAGLGYLLVGTIAGTGLWLGWGAPLRMAVPRELHLHANLWGFTSLVFAGLVVDLYPEFANRRLAWPASISTVFWLMTLGALGLVIGPWLSSNWFTMPGLVLYLGATLLLFLNVVRPLMRDRSELAPGLSHLISAYLWILVPLLAAPLMALRGAGQAGARVEQYAPLLLVFGWVLQFVYAVVPFLFARALLPDEPARLGGNRLSLVTVNLGGLFLAASIVAEPYQGPLQGAAFGLWAVSMLPIVGALWRIVRAGLARFELDEPVAEKVVAYITQGDRLLVFSHVEHPEAGLQVPAGTIQAGESPQVAVLREAQEETGLEGLEIRSFLGVRDYDLARFGVDGIQRRHYFHVEFGGRAPARWRHHEEHPSEGSAARIEFELFWVKFPGEVPELVAGQGDLLSEVRLAPRPRR